MSQEKQTESTITFIVPDNYDSSQMKFTSNISNIKTITQSEFDDRKDIDKAKLFAIIDNMLIDIPKQKRDKYLKELTKIKPIYLA